MATILVKDANANSVSIPITPIGQQASANSMSVVFASDQSALKALSTAASGEVVPTVTASSAYVAGNVVGAAMTFTNMLNSTTYNGILQSITLKFKASLQTGSYALAIFSGSPAGTYTDKSAPTFNASDNATLLGIYQLNTPMSSLGTHTIYNLDGIGKQIVGSSTSLYAVLIATTATVAYASTSDVVVRMSVIN